MRLRGAWRDFSQPIISITLNDNGKSSISSLADNSIGNHNEIFGGLWQADCLRKSFAAIVILLTLVTTYDILY